jgi:hypothetical protein
VPLLDVRDDLAEVLAASEPLVDLDAELRPGVGTGSARIWRISRSLDALQVRLDGQAAKTGEPA